MKTSQKGIDLIKKFEGCRLEAYRCPAGIWTIGYGHTKGVKDGQKITQEQAEELLRDDLRVYEQAVESCVKVPINQNQFDALVSFCYNCGAEALRTSTLLRLLNESKYSDAGEQFLRWNKAGGKVLVGLTRRREEERGMFLG